MAIYQISESGLKPAQETTYQSEGILERQNLQALLRDSIKIIDDDVMVLTEEFGDWEDSRRRIDLLCLDRDARLVVVELKRTDDGGHMELQAVRYAAMVSKMTFPAAVETHRSFLRKFGRNPDAAEDHILNFLGWAEPQEETFANDVRLVLASAEFSKEVMTAVMWLSEHDIDISCVRLKPYKLDDKILVDVQQIFPLPEAADYQVKIREKERRERQARMQNRELTRFDLTIGNESMTNLPKLRLAYQVVREAVMRGAAPRDVLKNTSAWVGIEGEHDKESFLARATEGRDPQSSKANINDFLTKDDELLFSNGSTYALNGYMWGLNTREELDRIIEEFDLGDVRYRESI